MNTRDKILESSKEIFNELGFGTPTLNTLSQSIGISRGNLTYYFKDKASILEALVDEMWLEYELLVARTTKFPSWTTTNKFIEAFLNFQKAYSFIFFDIKVMLLPNVAKRLEQMRLQSLEGQMALITFSIELGNMKAETIPGTYRNLSETIWMIQFHWAPSLAYRNNNQTTNWDKLIWSIILPHFTEKGMQSFINRFGEEYYQSLGDAFNHKQQQDVSF